MIFFDKDLHTLYLWSYPEFVLSKHQSLITQFVARKQNDCQFKRKKKYNLIVLCDFHSFRVCSDTHSIARFEPGTGMKSMVKMSQFINSMLLRIKSFGTVNVTFKISVVLRVSICLQTRP